MTSQRIKLLISILLPILVLLLPVSAFHIDGLTVVEQRVIAIFLMAALFWILEPIPIYATSLLIIFLELIMISTKGLKFVINTESPETFGTLIDYKGILYTFASPIIILFLGGFFLAMAATKYRLDQNLAKVLLKPFGENPKWVMLGLMIITAIFSMFMSNTATTAMMLSILVPVMAVFVPGDKGRIGFTLAIPFAANIGGIGTPIGTPPNAVALKYLTGSDYISFGSWMAMALPYVIVLLLIAWVLLIAIYPVKTEKIQLSIKGSWLKNRKAYIVYATFALTILLWLTDFVHGMNSYIVAMVPVAVFSAFDIINKNDLKNISWDVLWLVSGGIALGLALEKSGLAERLVNTIPFGTFSPILIIVSVTFVAMLMANFMSNTATANLLLPLVAALGVSLSSLDSFGGNQMIILAVTISCSMGMALPISTPPNALAFATGTIEQKNMAKPGVIIALIGLVLNYGLMYILGLVGFFN
ncbi:MAG: dihydroorotate dehydrogenase [Flammeovirgaceae bacterium]|nr:dihydroorotate dehydrogenase [Flammeovirgaceae bacterium]MBE63102.1 dihydroorotate dehydrogenase [Flammeovirgaceae bacterium]MBR09235.1 dihydroorotate dehydrogenase [Rickettsiales bacterium]|tara:strand:- start:2015 stop:3436 length:1422 start_codon:yes stop_codon:yes gene_type:complete